MTWTEMNEKLVRRAVSAWEAGRIEEAEAIFKEGLAPSAQLARGSHIKYHLGRAKGGRVPLGGR
jgi:hypothetical protein